MNTFKLLASSLRGCRGHDIPLLRQISTTSPVTSLEKTVLHDYHVDQGGKMVEFAGYSMPVQYGKVGIATSHNQVRNHCGMFDVSHMLQSRVHGRDRVKFVESLIVGDIEGLPDNSGTLSLFTNDQGGIIDDLICSKTDLGYLYVVSNAGCKEKDLAHMKQQLASFKAAGGDVELEIIEDHGLVAVQGPEAAKILQAVELCETLFASGVHLAGLGARDSLRLEAGLCLYGNDIDDTTTPIEAGLAWTIGKRRRQTADFPGAEIILKQLKDKPKRRRVGLTCTGPPPRSHCPVLDGDGNQVGEVTSGCPAPSLGKNVAMAYVPANLAKAGTNLTVQVRKKNIPAVVTKMPFVKCNYHIMK
ncbi:aminomethyltransferase, mitochondrial-like isoform X2 [Macrobrachium nipponense]|uniref:aminomethyltransferase, mitochondrial-like isoform X2 n=1 Tax=Macrobrachium nipponense TaxID=159736 RepID=UPI0030C8BF4A